MKTLLFAGSLLLVLASSALAEVDASKLIGTWEVPGEPRTTLAFKAGGVVVIAAEAGGETVTITGKYELTGDQLKVSINLAGDEKSETLKIVELTDALLALEDPAGKIQQMKRVD